MKYVLIISIFIVIISVLAVLMYRKRKEPISYQYTTHTYVDSTPVYSNGPSSIESTTMKNTEEITPSFSSISYGGTEIGKQWSNAENSYEGYHGNNKREPTIYHDTPIPPEFDSHNFNPDGIEKATVGNCSPFLKNFSQDESDAYYENKTQQKNYQLKKGFDEKKSFFKDYNNESISNGGTVDGIGGYEPGMGNLYISIVPGQNF